MKLKINGFIDVSTAEDPLRSWYLALSSQSVLESN